MNISLEWLAQYLPGPLDRDQLMDTLTHAGLPTENYSTTPLNDTVLDVEVTSNRGDCLSHVGIARELSALLNRPLKDPLAGQATEPSSSAGGAVPVSIAPEAADLCPHYTARIIRNVKVGPSPKWLAQRLENVGLRPVNNVVDVTNYILYELGQPLHAFDFDTLQGRQIVVRPARLGEKITSIDGHERRLQPWMLTISDENRPVALAGVMGGLDTEVSDSTVNILLESARFDPLSIRRTARALAMKSDSSYRFERGIDPTLPLRASLRAAQLILEVAGGTLEPGVSQAGGEHYSPKQLTLRLQRLARILGVELPTADVLSALTRLGFDPKLDGEVISVTVPSHRLDVNEEIDLVEEAARVVGYDKVPMRDEISIRLTPPDPNRITFDNVRNILVAGGYYEAVTFSWVADALAPHFIPPEAAGLPRAEHGTRKADAQLRPSLLPGLLEAVRRNESAGTPNAKLYEIGSTFYTDSAGKIVEQQRLGLVGSTDPREVRGVLETLLSRLDAAKAVAFIPDNHPGYTKGGSARIEWGGKTIGRFGKITREVADALSLREPPIAAELNMPALLAGAQHVPQLKPLPKFPSVRRDLSLVVDESLRYEKIDQLIRGQNLPNLEDLEYVTTYRGKPLEKSQKSITVTLVFRSPSTTLTSEQVEPAVQQVIESARMQLNATLRT